MGLLNDLQSDIEQQKLPRGGWASGLGSRAAIETICYALMALDDDHAPTRGTAVDLLLSLQNPNGSWPAFEGDDPEGCWTTALVMIALRNIRSAGTPIERGSRWLLENKGREAHWFWKWKFRTVDRHVHFDPDKYGWPWFPGTVSWIVPTAFSLLALRQSLPCCPTKTTGDRIRIGTEMLRDRACPQGGWNAGNGSVFGSPLLAHVDTTAIALLALTGGRPASVQALNWLRRAFLECTSLYSLAWCAMSFLIHQDQALDPCMAKLRKALVTRGAFSNIETVSLAAIAVRAAEGNANPFEAGGLK